MTENNEDNLFSIESEKAVLSIILNYPQKIYEVTTLKPEAFSNLPNKALFNCMQELAETGVVPEPTMLEEHLKDTGRLDSVGGSEYLKYLSSISHPEDNFKRFEAIIVDSYKARGILGMVAKVPSMLQHSNNVGSVIEFVRESLEKLVMSSGGEMTNFVKAVLPDVWENIKVRLSNPGVRGFHTGFKDIDNHTGGINPGELWIIASRTSHGKTSWICNSIVRSTQANGTIPLVFSKEMNTQSFMERLLSIDTGVPLSAIRQGLLNQTSIDLLSQGVQDIAELPIILDANFGADLYYITNTIRKFVRSNGVNVVYIDYVQLIAERNSQSVHELGEISRTLKILCNELDIGIYLISQINRNVEYRDDKRPSLSDLRQSGNLEEDADLVAMLYREEMYNETNDNRGVMEFIIRKNRNGPMGTIMLKFDKETTRITGM